MKVLVVYDSLYGNTAKIAQAIRSALGDALDAPEHVALLAVGEVQVEDLAGLDLLVVGSPTQRFRPTMATSAFLKSIAKNALKGINVAAFDTRFTEEEIKSTGWFLSSMVDIFGYAAQPIADRLEKKGGVLVMAPEGFYVDGMEGPLSEGEIERAADWARRVLQSTHLVHGSPAIHAE